MMKRMQGVTLIELMIVVVIMGILAAIAYPSYQDYVAKGVRAEGLAELMRVINLQEQYYLDHRVFTTDMKALGLSADPYITSQGHYQIDTKVTNGTYEIEATALGGQALRDSGCALLTIDHAGNKNKQECWK